MQTSAPEAVDLTKETAATREAYGIGDPSTNDYGTNLLRARRLVERGVRFVHVISGSPDDSLPDWDAHNSIEKNHAVMAKLVDKPIAALLGDLKARGLLDSTLVVWTSEFGRTPYGQTGDGRDHNPWGFTTWLAGGGSKAGTTLGSTDDIGLRATKDIVDTYDLQATVLHLLGLNHRNLTYQYQGRAERATTVFGDVVKGALA
jgi:membrane-anchored protein YejM (alkaline phosphatase superfamily)